MTRGRAAAIAAALASLHLACSSAEEVKCPAGSGLCGSVCKPLDSDRENCGACGNACGSGQVCTAGACVADCAASLRAPLRDRWGEVWDGLERTTANFETASAACAAIGGRLPTATEIYRVSASQTADVGQTYQTNWLWTSVPRDASNNFIAAINDGSVTYSASTTARSYRCVCPPPMPAGFSGYACNGPPAAPCVALSGGNAGLAMDASDRASLTVGGAMWECAQSGGQLPSFLTYSEAIVEGLPNGSGSWLQTADFVRYDWNAVVQWTGTETSWAAGTKTATGALTDLRPFRCVGRAATAAPNPGRPADAFVGVGARAADVADRSGTSWAAAHDACWADGGHLAYSVELGSLVQQGLGGGSGAGLWTAEQEGHDGTQFCAGDLYWTGTDRRFGEFWGTYVAWFWKSDSSHAFRCVYYPVNPSYVAPTNCWQGCTQIALPGSGGAKLWLDAQDRADASFISAIGTCRAAGGHLATERDYTEAIRASLGYGSSTWLHAADLARGSAAAIQTMVVRWTNVAGTSYTDQWSTFVDWSALSGGPSRPYRCVWTNELR